MRWTRQVAERVTPRHHLWPLVVALSLLWVYAGWSGAAETEQTKPLAVPIALSDIPTRASGERTLLDQAEALLARTAVLDGIEQDLLERERAMTRDLVSLAPALAAASSRDALSEIEHTWLELDRALEESEAELRRWTGAIQQQAERLQSALDVWTLTVDQAREAKAPEEVVALARSTADDVARLQTSVHGLQDRALALQAKAGQARGSVQESLDRIRAEETDLLNNLARRERPPLWSEVVTGVSVSKLVANAGHELRGWASTILNFFASEYDRIAFQIFMLFILTAVLRRSRGAARRWTAADPTTAKGMAVFERPFALASLLVLMLTPWFYVYTPPAVTDAVGLLLVLPVLALILPLLEPPTRPALFGLAILYVVDQFRDLVESAPLVARLIFILEMIAAIAIVIWVIRSRFWHRNEASARAQRWQNLIRLALNAALLLLVIATLAALAGYVRLAVLIGSGVLNSIYLALLLVALERTAESLIKLTLHSRAAQSFAVIRTRTARLTGRLGMLLRLVVIAIWVFLTLDFLAVQDVVWDSIKGIFLAEFRTGAVAVSLADVLAFAVTIIAAVLLARFIVTILDEDVYPRISLGRGVSFAISSVIKYGIIVLGFLVAVGAMGVGMDRITILLGAFGVGLGFGLQTVVNNFVSGMILIFERPVQIGDSVEVGSIKGRITRIGIRSSTVRSFDGADITIPNGTLLSDALTNWTLTDRNRRIEIAVGVAYGSDVDVVIEALRSALDDQTGLLEEPAPQVVFEGFGDSSLNFLLRAWVADNDEFVSIRSSVALAVNRALKERDIEIPFPQRDLHLRSVAPDIRLPDAT